MDSAAFKEVILSQYRQMYRIAYTIVGKQEDAEDIVQDAMLKMWDRRHLLDDVKNYPGYCSMIVRNQSIDFVRKQKNQADDEYEQEALLVADVQTADSAIEQQEMMQQVNNLLDSMPVNVQRVMQLRVFSECSIEDIGKITGFTNGNIRTMLSRARKQMKEFFVIQNR